MAIIIIIMGLATAWAIGYMYVMFLRILLVNPVSKPKENINNFTSRRQHKYKAEDFYDEPDGFYVTMPDGSVRIDD